MFASSSSYDCRLYLYDLSEYDETIDGSAADAAGDTKKKQRAPRSTSEELEVERMCEEERYMFLNDKYDDDNDDREHDEATRANSGRPYGCVGMEYDDDTTRRGAASEATDGPGANEPKNMPETPFVPTESLKLPVGMLTVCLFAIDSTRL